MPRHAIEQARGLPLADDFVFDLNEKRPRFSNQMLLDQVRAFAETIGGRPFTHEEFKAWPRRRCSSICIANRFGTWRRALAAAGIDGANTAMYDPRELIERLEKAWRALGRRPGVDSLPIHGGVSITPYRRHWGTFMRACELFVQFKRGRITLNQLLRPQRCPPRRRTMSVRLRWKVLSRDGHRCRSCGRSSLEKGVRLEVDHIVPVSLGGTDEPSNLRALCWECNHGKGGRAQGGRHGKGGKGLKRCRAGGSRGRKQVGSGVDARPRRVRG